MYANGLANEPTTGYPPLVQGKRAWVWVHCAGIKQLFEGGSELSHVVLQSMSLIYGHSVILTQAYSSSTYP